MSKRNIKLIYKALFRFVRQYIPELRSQATKFDWQAVAENPDPQGIGQVSKSAVYISEACTIIQRQPLNNFISQLLVVMLAAAAMGPENEKFVNRIRNELDKQTQTEIVAIVMPLTLGQTASMDDDEFDEAIDAVMEARDVDLVFEEQNASLHKELEDTRERLADRQTRLEDLTLSYEELAKSKHDIESAYRHQQEVSRKGAMDIESTRHLHNRIDEQNEIIARLEEEIHSSEKAHAIFDLDYLRLKKESDEYVKLRDEVAELKHKNEDLEKRANAADRYRQKLESQQDLVKEVQNLQYEHDELHRQNKALTRQLELANRKNTSEQEISKLLQQSEVHLWDERNQKAQLQKECAALTDDVLRLEARQNHDEKFIKELEEQLQDQSSPRRRNSVVGSSSTNLADELDSADEDGQSKVNLRLEYSRLKAENDLLRSTVGSTGETAQLRRELDEEKRQRAHVQKNYNQLFENHAVAQDQIEALITNMTGDGLVKAFNDFKISNGTHVLTGSYYSHKAFINLRTELMQAQFELEQAKKREKDLNAQVADQSRDLLSVRAQLAVIDKESIDAMTELNRTDVTIITSLKAELDRSREDLSYSNAEREAQQTQLVEALLANQKLRKEAEEGKELQAAAGTLESADTSEAGKNRTELIEKLRARLREIREVSPHPLVNLIKYWQTTSQVASAAPAKEESTKSVNVSLEEGSENLDEEFDEEFDEESDDDFDNDSDEEFDDDSDDYSDDYSDAESDDGFDGESDEPEAILPNVPCSDDKISLTA